MEVLSPVPPFCCNYPSKFRWIVIFMTSRRKCNKVSQLEILRELRECNFRISRRGKLGHRLPIVFTTAQVNAKYWMRAVADHVCNSTRDAEPQAWHTVHLQCHHLGRPFRKHRKWYIPFTAEPSEPHATHISSTAAHLSVRLPRARSHFCLRSNAAQASG
jgi:hypothetical protein